MGLKLEDIDLAGAGSLGSRLVRLAELSPRHEINLTETTDLLLALGVTRSGRDSLRSTINQKLRKMPEFVKCARGWWVLGEPEDDSHAPDILARADVNHTSLSDKGRGTVKQKSA